MRVLCVGNRYPPWTIGGYEVTFAGTVAALRRAGHAVRVLTTVPDPTDLSAAEHPSDVHRELRWYWRNHEFPRVGLAARARLERANAATLTRHLRSFAPDVIMWWGMGGMSLSLIELARRAGVPAVGAVGDEWMSYGPEVDAWSRLWRGRARFAAAVAERATGVPAAVDLDRGVRWAFNSRYTLAAARETGWRLRDAVVIHPGVDPERFRLHDPGPWGWRLLYCGRIDPRKGIATAVEALARLPPQATLTIHGDGDAAHRSELESLASSLGVRERVRFERSPHELVADAYAAADVLIFPVTWREPWGLVPLEAMSVGRPVIATSAGGGPAEYLEDGRNCLQFAPGDHVALADALQRLAGSPELRDALRRKGRKTAALFPERAFHHGLERELQAAIAREPSDDNGDERP